ncbi:WAP four-disulfide core domain protein 5-like [Pseudophryne corroboree]|uniref:WAP four-disulfide core domain protein 5-like n=1 Tax=Pseudophryne corroboree TaxID=495146 RepID=UPI00308193F1
MKLVAVSLGLVLLAAVAAAEKPGDCPVTPTLIKCEKDPNPGCGSDSDCGSYLKCCNYACHIQCVEPAGKKPGECLVVNTFAPCGDSTITDCTSDWACGGSQKCCDTGCHIQCADPVAKS